MNAGKLKHCSCTRRNTSIGHQHQKLRKRQGLILPRLSEEVWSCWLLNFRLLASSTMRQISVVLSHLVCSTLVWQPQKTSTVSVSHIFSLLSRTSTNLVSFCPIQGERTSIHMSLQAQQQWHSLRHVLSFWCPEEYPSTLLWAESHHEVASQWGWPGLSNMSWWGQKNKTQLNAITLIHFTLGVST